MGGKVCKKIVSWDYATGEDYFEELFRVSKEQIIWGGNYKVYVRTAGYKARERVFEAEEAVHRLQVADVAPVRRGHWIEENGCQICSECGEGHEWDEYRAAYCDVCGAEMEVDNGN